MDVFIYSLTDPKTKEIRYVGKAVDCRRRFDSHLTDNRSSSHKHNWIKSLLSAGLKPELEVLEVIYNSDDRDWQDAERWWISYLRFIGCRLTNLDSGGKSGTMKPLESRIKMSLAKIGKKRAPEVIESQRQKMKGRKPSPQCIAASVAQKKKFGMSEQAKINIREAALRSEYVATDEHRKRMSEAARAAWAEGRRISAPHKKNR